MGFDKPPDHERKALFESLPQAVFARGGEDAVVAETDAWQLIAAGVLDYVEIYR